MNRRAEEPNDLNVSGLLARWRGGSREAEEALLDAVYPVLHRMASRFMAHERPEHTLQPTALVHEAYIHMVRARDRTWENSTHFFAACARVMRHVLVDHARERRAQKRGGANARTTLHDETVWTRWEPEFVLALHAALEQLEAIDPRQSRVVELRHFGGLANDEIAEVLGVSQRTVKRDWLIARAWLFGKLAQVPPQRSNG